MTYLARRLLLFLVTLLLITVVTFLITSVLPGDVATMILGTRSNPVTLAALRVKLGLDQPLAAQYWHWISGMLVGNFGVSLVFKEPIAALLAQKITASVMLAVLFAGVRARGRGSARRVECGASRRLAGHGR